MQSSASANASAPAKQLVKPTPNTYRQTEQKVWKDMGKRTSSERTSSERNEPARNDQDKEIDPYNASVAASTAQQPQNAQDRADIEAELPQEDVVKVNADRSVPNGIVDILEGFGTPYIESDGPEQMDFTELLQSVIQDDINPQATDFKDADPFAQLQENPAMDEQAGSLENMNNVMEGEQADAAQGQAGLLGMLKQALAGAGKDQQADTRQEDTTETATGEAAATMQTQRPSGVQESSFVETIEQPQQVSQADMADNVSRLVESIQASAVSDTQKEFTVHLKPEFLGKLSVKLVMDDDGIRAMIKANDVSSKNLILNELPQLEEALRGKGLDVKQVEVTYEAAQFDFNPQQDSQSWYFSQQNKPNRYAVYATEQETMVSFLELSQGIAQYATPEGSSMEFHA